MHYASIAAFALSMSAASALLFVAGCNTAKLTPADPGDASCPNQLEYPCKAQPLGTAGCTPNAASTDVLEVRIEADASYPEGCTVVVPEIVPDESGQCVIDGTCRCNAGDGGLAWTCTR